MEIININSISNDPIGEKFKPEIVKINSNFSEIKKELLDNVGIPGKDGNDGKDGIDGNGSLSFSTDEKEIGIFTFFGEDHTIYNRVFKLTELPTTLADTQEFILCDEPLGFNLYLEVAGFSVSTGKAIKSEFFKSLYEITKIYVNDSMQTVLVLRCNEATTEVLQAVVVLQYIKFFGDEIDFTVHIPDGVDPENVELSFPALKYDKDYVLSYTIDDCWLLWNWAFCVINHKPVSKGEFYAHMGYVLGTHENDSQYTTPPRPLEYTNGCGITKRFALTQAVFWTWLMEDTPANGIVMNQTAYPYTYDVELKYMQD